MNDNNISPLWNAWEKTAKLFESSIKAAVENKPTLEAMQPTFLDMQVRMTKLMSDAAAISMDLTKAVMDSIKPPKKDD